MPEPSGNLLQSIQFYVFIQTDIPSLLMASHTCCLPRSALLQPQVLSFEYDRLHQHTLLLLMTVRVSTSTCSKGRRRLASRLRITNAHIVSRGPTRAIESDLEGGMGQV